jgi:hypothetical protein
METRYEIQGEREYSKGNAGNSRVLQVKWEVKDNVAEAGNQIMDRVNSHFT